MDMILTGRPVPADEALAMGLANYVVEPGESRQEAEKIANAIAQFPNRCMVSDREAVYRGFDLPMDQAMELEFRSGLEVVKSGESEEGAIRFSQRGER
jgi:enoyl-CoA hydratase